MPSPTCLFITWGAESTWVRLFTLVLLDQSFSKHTGLGETQVPKTSLHSTLTAAGRAWLSQSPQGSHLHLWTALSTHPSARQMLFSICSMMWKKNGNHCARRPSVRDIEEGIPRLSRCLHQTTDVGSLPTQTQIPHCASPLSHGLEFSGFNSTTPSKPSLFSSPDFSCLVHSAAALLVIHLGSSSFP